MADHDPERAENRNGPVEKTKKFLHDGCGCSHGAKGGPCSKELLEETVLFNLNTCLELTVGGAVASWLVRSTPERAVRVRALAGNIVLCSWARHFTLTVPLSTQVYKWVPANLMLGVTLRWTSIPSRGE